MMTTDFICLLNRLHDDGITHDGWMHVCPFGEFPWTSEDGKETIIQVIDAQAVRAMANAYPLSDLDALIDFEHESMTNKGSTAGAGWGKEARQEITGLWIKADWSTRGRAAVEGKEFKFNSPCFPRDGLQHLGGNRYRVTKLGRIALTNNPNLKGQMPLTNRRAEAANPNTKNTSMDYKAELLKLLGLPPEATDDQIAAACAGLGADAKKKMDALNSRVTEMQTQLTNADLDAHGIKDDAQRKLFAPLLANSATRDDALKTLQQLKPATKVEPPIHNRANAQVPSTDQQLSGADLANAEAEKTAASWIGSRANELKNRNPARAFRDCFAQAQADYAAKGK